MRRLRLYILPQSPVFQDILLGALNATHASLRVPLFERILYALIPMAYTVWSNESPRYYAAANVAADQLWRRYKSALVLCFLEYTRNTYEHRTTTPKGPRWGATPPWCVVYASRGINKSSRTPTPMHASTIFLRDDAFYPRESARDEP